MLNVQLILPNTEFTIEINGVLPKLSADLENEVERLWLAEQKLCGKAIFNGRIMSASTVSSVGIHGYIVEYRYWIAQRARPELFKDLQVRPVAVSGLFECLDGIVFGRRAASMTQDAGLWELVPSGGIDTSKINNENSTVRIDYLSQMLTELHQEIGITSSFVSSIRPFCLVDDVDAHVLDIGIAIKSPLSGDEVLRAHCQNATKEYDKLHIAIHTDASNFVQHKALPLVKVSEKIIQFYYEKCATTSEALIYGN